MIFLIKANGHQGKFFYKSHYFINSLTGVNTYPFVRR